MTMVPSPAPEILAPHRFRHGADVLYRPEPCRGFQADRIGITAHLAAHFLKNGQDAGQMGRFHLFHQHVAAGAGGAA